MDNGRVWDKDAGYELQTEVPPDPSPSTFSVSECPGNMDAVRASTEEFFKAAEGAIPNAVVVDARPVEDWNADVDNLSPFQHKTRAIYLLSGLRTRNG